jgi:hypothetical protein
LRHHRILLWMILVYDCSLLALRCRTNVIFCLIAGLIGLLTKKLWVLSFRRLDFCILLNILFHFPGRFPLLDIGCNISLKMCSFHRKVLLKERHQFILFLKMERLIFWLDGLKFINQFISVASTFPKTLNWIKTIFL